MVTVTVAASDGDPACASSRSVDVVCTEPAPQMPIKHIIVFIGENRSFDHMFGSYVPRAGQTIANLASKGIIHPDGTPGPNFALAAHSEAAPQPGFYVSTDDKTRYAVLPGPSTSGAPTAQRPTAPPFQTVDQARLETDLDPADLALLTTGATGLPTRVLDTRVASAGALPDGPFQLTGPTMPYDACTGDSIHRFYQMWQQTDCPVSRATATNPTGCLNDLFPVVAISFSTADNGVGNPMAFLNMNSGDAPSLRILADNFAMSDSMHQAVQGGTGANHSMLDFGDQPRPTPGAAPSTTATRITCRS